MCCPEDEYPAICFSNHLLPYQRALSGRPGPERFILELDTQPFRPEEQVLIGFGERPAAQTTARDFLVQSGLASSAIDSTLIQYGLEGQGDIACSKLGESAQRQIQLLAAAASSAAVFILNDPFSALASQWRERFAELILSDAREKHRITIVTSLSQRPQCWIGNELVNRIQVGETLQKTIGFGQASTQMNDLVAQLRSQLVQQPGLGASEMIKPNAPHSTVESVQTVNVSHSPTVGAFGTLPISPGIIQLLKQHRTLAFTVGAVFLLLVVMLLGRGEPSQIDVKVATLPTPLAQRSLPPVSPQPSVGATNRATSAATQAPVTPAPHTPGDSITSQPTTLKTPLAVATAFPSLVVTKPPTSLLVDLYPAAIRTALLRVASRAPAPLSSDGLNSPSRRVTKSASAPGQDVSAGSKPSIFNELTAASGTASDEPGSEASTTIHGASTGQTFPGQNVQERQEALRQKFLDAINRAVEARQQ